MGLRDPPRSQHTAAFGVKCAECKFYEAAESANGICHRNPPQFRTDFRFPQFPIVPSDAWCGEYEAKPAPETKKRTLSLKR